MTGYTEIPNSVKSIWLIRGPGMVLKVVLCETETNESTVKQVYRQSINCRRTDLDMDPEIEWPVCEVIAKDKFLQKYANLLQFSQTTNEQPRVLWIRKPEGAKK